MHEVRGLVNNKNWPRQISGKNSRGQKWSKIWLFLLFLKIHSLDFSDIDHEVKGLWKLKADLGRCLGKILVCPNLWKGTKMDFFLLFLKIQSLFFSSIDNVQLEDYRLKTDLGRFFGKVLFAQILSKSPQNKLFRLLLKIAQSSFVDIWCVVTGHETLINGLCMFLKIHSVNADEKTCCS